MPKDKHITEAKRIIAESRTLNEAKEETHRIGAVERTGITTTKKDHSNPDYKAFDVHYKGEHIGHIESYGTTAVRKKNSVRMQDSGKMRTKWSLTHKKSGRSDYQLSSKGDATKELVGRHLRDIGEY